MLVYPKVLTIAGSDSGGGAGIQADLKTISALGCFGMSAITAVTAQNTLGVSDIHPIPPNIVKSQIQQVVDDIGTDAIKIGMLHDSDIVRVVADAIHNHQTDIPFVVLDPVMVASSGDKLIKDHTIEMLITHLFPKASVITPNIPEAEIILGKGIPDQTHMLEAAQELLALGSTSVLLKGGHLPGDRMLDIFIANGWEEPLFLYGSHITTPNTHGTGCTLSSAIASYHALGYQLNEAIQKAHSYIHRAIAAGKDVVTGSGHGPVNHFFAPKSMTIRNTDSLNDIQ